MTRPLAYTALVASTLLLGCIDDSTEAPAGGLGAVVEPAIEWNPERYVAYRTDDPITVDGRLNEPSWQDAQWTANFVDIEGPGRPAPRFRTRAKMLWDSTDLYLGAEMEEPHVWGTLTERDAIIYLNNDFEVFIDPDGDTHEYFELEINALGTEWDLLLVRPYRDGGPAIHAWDIPGLKSGVHIQGTLNDPSDRDRGWTVEIAMPWSAMKEGAGTASPPGAGDQWRVNFSRVQWRANVVNGRYVKISEPPEGHTRPEDNWVWSPQGIINMHYPEMWGVVQFSGLSVGQQADLFLPRREDEAKWALRRVYYRERQWFRSHGRFTTDVAALGLADFSVPGYSGPQIAVTPNLFEAWLTQPDGGVLRVSQNGRVW